MRVWLDDIRTMPEDYDVWVKNAYFCMGLIISGNVTHISFDHDLGLYDGKEDEENTGYAVAQFIEEWAFNYYIRKSEKTELKPITWDIHSANPVGRENIEMAMKSAERFWRSHEHSNS